MMRWQVQKMDKLQFLVADTGNLFIALTVAVTSEGMAVKRVLLCLMTTKKKNEKCVCVRVCWLGERRRRVKVQRIPSLPLRL